MPTPETQSPPAPPTQASQRITDAVKRLKERGALKDDKCPQCENPNWYVDFIALPSVPLPDLETDTLPDAIRRSPSTSTWNYSPSVRLTCTNCGNTLIHSLFALGLLPKDTR